MSANLNKLYDLFSAFSHDAPMSLENTVKKAIAFGMQKQREGMRCGTCKHLHSWIKRNECQHPEACCYDVDLDYGCVLHEQKEEHEKKKES